jgi:hypothetical protein
MSKIELTQEEINAIHDDFNGDIGIGATEEQQRIFIPVIKKAEALMFELDAAEESGGDLIAWFWGKYLKQEGLFQIDSIEKVRLTKRQKAILEAMADGEYMRELTTDERKDLVEVVSIACSFIAETNAYKDLNKSDEHYLAWFLGKYLEQKRRLIKH